MQGGRAFSTTIKIKKTNNNNWVQLAGYNWVLRTTSPTYFGTTTGHNWVQPETRELEDEKTELLYCKPLRY